MFRKWKWSSQTLITPLITTHEPPSRASEVSVWGLGFGLMGRRFGLCNPRVRIRIERFKVRLRDALGLFPSVWVYACAGCSLRPGP